MNRRLGAASLRLQETCRYPMYDVRARGVQVDGTV